MPPSVVRLGHCGASGLYPESTLLACRRAVEQGVDMLEVDVHRTRDGENDNFIFEGFVLGAEGTLLGFSTIGTREQVEMLAAWWRGDIEMARRDAPRHRIVRLRR